jgi:hypothetical protein
VATLVTMPTNLAARTAARTGRYAQVRRLRGAVWISYVLHQSGQSLNEFSDRCLYGSRSRSGLAAKWARGEVNPCRQTARRVEADVPGSEAVFCHPIFELLKGAPITDHRVWKLLSGLPSVAPSVNGPRHIKISERRHLCEIRPLNLRWKDRPVSTPRWAPPDSWQLRAAPSFDNLAKMVGLIRVAEDPRYPHMHFYWSMDVFRYLPSCLQEPWLAPFLDRFTDALEAVCARTLGSVSSYFAVDRALLGQQLQWKGFRSLYPNGHDQDPILLTKIGRQTEKDMLSYASD